jgi:hypothetical protein
MLRIGPRCLERSGDYRPPFFGELRRSVVGERLGVDQPTNEGAIDLARIDYLRFATSDIARRSDNGY